MSVGASRSSWIDTTIALAIATGLLYVAGWSYSYHWLDWMDIGLFGLGVPKEYQLIYGFWVLQRLWWVILLLAAVTALVAWAARRWVPSIQGALLVAGALAAFPLSYAGGARVARQDYASHRETGFEQYPWVRIWLTDDASAVDARMERLRGDLAGAKYRLLIEASHGVYVIKPTSQSEPATVEIPWGEIRSLRRLPTHPGGR